MQFEFFNQVLKWCAGHKANIVRAFYFFFLIYFPVIALGGYFIASKSELVSISVLLGNYSAKFAVLAFFGATYPGMLGRFGIKNPIITLGMMFRREVGIASFFFALGHASLFYIIPKLVFGLPLLQFLVFELFGVVAFLLLTMLYVTSNKYARQVLGPWWKKLHSLVYVIYWLIFAHVVIQGISITSVLIGISAVLELASLIYAKKHKIIVTD